MMLITKNILKYYETLLLANESRNKVEEELIFQKVPMWKKRYIDLCAEHNLIKCILTVEEYDVVNKL